MRIIAVSIFLIFTSFLVTGQDASADIKNLTSQVNDLEFEEFEKQLNVYFAGSDQTGDPKETYTSLNQIARAVSDSPKDPQTLPKVYRYFGQLFQRQGNYEVALELFNKSLRISRVGTFKTLEALTLNDIGNIFFNEGNLSRAEEQYQEALEISQRLEDKHPLAVTYNNLALIERKRENYPKARELHYTALDIRKYLKNNYLTGHSYTYIGDLNKIQGNILSAAEMYKKAISSFEKALSENDNQSSKERNKIELQIAFTELSLADIYTRLDNKNEVIKILDHIEKLAVDVISLYKKSNLLIEAGTISFRVQEYNRAKTFTKGAFNIANANGYKKEMVKSYDLLAAIYKQLGDFEQAMVFKDIQGQLENELAEEKLKSQTMHLDLTHSIDIEKQAFAMGELRTELDAAKADLRSSNLLQNLLTALCAFLVIGSLAIVFLMRRSNRASKQNLNKKLDILYASVEKEKKLNQQLNSTLEYERSNNDTSAKEKAKIVSIIAHDLRTPLNSIIGLIDLIEMEDENKPSDKERYMKLIRESSKRMLNMINTILSLRKIENDQYNVSISEVNVGDASDGLVKEFDQWVKLKDITVNQNIPDGLIAKADPTLFEQVLQNLVSNAIKFSPLNSSISIEGKEIENNTIEVRVTDNGPGISKEDKKKLFKKYQKLSAKPTAGEDSLGIGLSIVKQLTESMNGAVRCESTLGDGATFIITFPKA